jgi:Na+/H+ antiporter NhaD/arsenite permease-like protein
MPGLARPAQRCYSDLCMDALQALPLHDVNLLAAYSIFIASYFVFALGKFPGFKIDRPGAAIIGAVAMVAFRIVPPREALHFIDFPTIVLLFSMMLIVGNLHLVGFFEWSMQFVLRRLKPALLLPAVVFACGVFSAFFVNDIVCLVMVPFVLTIARRMKLAPLPYLLAVATGSNVGSVATITGNPQNMLIGSFSGITYRDFALHLAPVALAGLFLDWGVLHWMFMHGRASEAPPESIPLPSLDLSHLTKPVIVVAVVVGGFLAGVPPAMMAALGAAALLITRTIEPRKLYESVDWGLLVFFVGLFLIVGGAENAGIVAHLLDFARHWNLQRLDVFTVVVALLSNIVSNVPAVMLLKSLVPGFSNPHVAWLALAMGSTLAGNLTITGSVANIIVVETAKPDVHIGFWDYCRVGFPITLLTILVGLAWLALVQ